MKLVDLQKLERRIADCEERLDNIDSTTCVEIDGKEYPVSRVKGIPVDEEVKEVMDAIEEAEETPPDAKDVN